MRRMQENTEEVKNNENASGTIVMAAASRPGENVFADGLAGRVDERLR